MGTAHDTGDDRRFPSSIFAARSGLASPW
jgi:hypothetical protein